MAMEMKNDNEDRTQTVLPNESSFALKSEKEYNGYSQFEANYSADNDLAKHSTEEISAPDLCQIKQEYNVSEETQTPCFSIMEIEETNLKMEPTQAQGPKKNQCWVCQKSFRGKCLLDIHMRTHTGEKPFNCELCGKNFRQKAALKTHLLNHTKIKPFKCDQCDKTFVAEKYLTAHALTHSAERPFTCEFCERKFVSEKTLRYHKAQHTRGYPFPCDICDMRFCYKHQLRRHILTHTGEKPYKCKYCPKGFKQRHESIVHMQTHPEIHSDKNNPSLQVVMQLINSLPREGDIVEARELQTSNPPTDPLAIPSGPNNVEQQPQPLLHVPFQLHSDIQQSTSSEIKVKSEPLDKDIDSDCIKKFVCKCCGARFALQNTLSHHVRQNMCSQQHFTCPHEKCQKVFASQEKLDAHVLSHTNCDLCGLSFNNSDEIERHKEEQHNLKVKHHCPFPKCNKAFFKGGPLEKHIEKHSIKKEFPCTLCDKSFHRKFFLTQHMNRHTKTRPFQCEQCAKAFYSSGELQRHLLRHTGDRPYQCDVCDKSYPLASELKAHKQTHSGELPFACQFCPMRFGLANVLRKHLITHTDERSHKCTICGRGFVHKQNCEDHMRTHTGEKEYGCEVCGTRYFTRDSLRKHMRVHKNVIALQEDVIETL